VLSKNYKKRSNEIPCCRSEKSEKIFADIGSVILAGFSKIEKNILPVIFVLGTLIANIKV